MTAPAGGPPLLPRSPGAIAPGALVVARAWKYDGSGHWVVPGFYLGQDAHGHWLHQPAGSLVARPGAGHLAAGDALCLIPHEGYWVATLYEDPSEDFDVYIDLADGIGWQPLKRGAWEVNSIDMDLDVIRSGNRGTFLDDEDEFAQHSASMGYPHELRQRIRHASEQLLELVARDADPFNREYRATWRRRALDLPRGGHRAAAEETNQPEGK